MHPGKWNSVFCVLCVSVSLLVLSVPAGAMEAPSAIAQERGLTTKASTTEQRNEALIKAAQNPIANMVSVPFQNNFNLGYVPQMRAL